MVDSTKPYYDVIIATPGSSFTTTYVKSLADILTHLASNGITCKYLNAKGSPVHIAREAVDDLIEQYDYKKVVFIDSDIGYTVEDFMKLYNSPKDIITGCYLLPDNKLTAVHAIGSGMPYTKDQVLKLSPSVLSIDSCGFGFIAISKVVLDRLHRPRFEMKVIPQGPKHAKLQITTGEDLSFCIKAKKYYSIYFDPTTKTQLNQW
jgi:hypothetical protein